jgi:hypothetical protein
MEPSVRTSRTYRKWVRDALQLALAPQALAQGLLEAGIASGCDYTQHCELLMGNRERKVASLKYVSFQDC